MEDVAENIFKRDLHVHLHGCLTAKDLHELGKSRWQFRQDQLRWYANEYQRATGTIVNPHDYWHCEDGLSKLRKDYEVSLNSDDNITNDRFDFDVFQARFNLIIALLPIAPNDDEVIRLIAARDLEDQELEHREYRIFVPPRFSASDFSQYLETQSLALLNLLNEYGSIDDQPKLTLVVSLPRSQNLQSYYETLRTWQTRSQGSRLLTGIDFCGDETLGPPATLASFIHMVALENSNKKYRPLNLLLHVGEQWHKASPTQALEWVAAATALPITRLGHALILRESPTVLARSSSNIDRTSAEAISVLQQKTLNAIAEKDLTIEVCPSSNFFMTSRHSNSNKPIADAIAAQLLPLVKAKVPYVIGTDDPGLFGTTMTNESRLIREALTTIKI